MLQPSIEPFHARALFHEIDTDGDGMIDIEEFIQSMTDGNSNQNKSSSSVGSSSKDIMFPLFLGLEAGFSSSF